jgi:hypothetical protein
MKRFNWFPFMMLMVLMLLIPAEQFVLANGISVDAGLTPARDRWIFRTQLRLMGRGDDPTAMDREMDMLVWNNVLAYGLLRNLTVMIRQPVIRRTMTMMTMAGGKMKSSGAGDLGIMVKYGMYRRNTRNSTFGVAALLGFGIPTGAQEVSSDTWNMKPGLYFSWRGRPWAADISVAYNWNSFTGKDSLDFDPGDELALDMAVSYQFSFGEKSRVALAPVMELSYKKVTRDQMNGLDIADSGESVLFLSPGIKLVVSSFILEALLQVPVWQKQEGIQLKRTPGLLFGIRWMF